MLESNQQAVAQMQAAQVNQQAPITPLGGVPKSTKKEEDSLFEWNDGDAIEWGQ